jgi:chromosome segregation ATPase
LVLEESSKAIPESEIPGRLDKTQALVALYEKLREQLEALRLRLSELQDQEKQAGEELESTRALLNQSALLARSNTFLESIAAAEINRLQQTQEQLLLDLKNRQRGSVEKKAKAASGLLERIGATASGWMEKMDKELGTLKGELGGKLAELENIAPLEESAIVEARRLMAEGQAFGPEGRKRSVDREEQVLAIKRRSEYWQNLQAALNAVDDMAAPVLESYEAMQHNRQYAIDRIADITAWMRSSQHWPPTSVTIDAERHDLEETDRKWEALKARPAKAINLVQTIGNLAARYATIGDRVQSSAEHVAQEKGQVESLEDEIDELAAQWQQQIQSYGQSPEAGEEIRRLLGDLQGQREALKRQYRQGTRSYEEIMQTLKELQRQLRNAQVTVDDNHVIDVNGRLIAYR